MQRTMAAGFFDSLNQFYSESNQVFGRTYRRADRVPFLAFFEVQILFSEVDADGTGIQRDAKSVVIQPDEVVLLRGRPSLTWREFLDLPVKRRRELEKNLGATIVRNTWMSAIRALTPGLLKRWRFNQELVRRLKDRSESEGEPTKNIKIYAIESGLLQAARDRMRRQDVRLGSHVPLLRDVVPGCDLQDVELMKWFKKHTFSAAEAWLREEEWPRTDGGQRTDTYDRRDRSLSAKPGPDGRLEKRDESPSADQILDGSALWGRVVKECTPEMEEVLRLRVQHLSQREIAERTKSSRSKVRGLLGKLKAVAARINDPDSAS